MNRSTAAAAAALLGLCGAAAPTAAHAALDQEVLEAVAAPEMADVALGVAAVLEGMAPDTEAQTIAAALHAYLSASSYSDEMILGGLNVVMQGDWSDAQSEALRSLFSRYVPRDLVAPSGAQQAALQTIVTPPGGGAPAVVDPVVAAEPEPDPAAPSSGPALVTEGDASKPESNGGSNEEASNDDQQTTIENTEPENTEPEPPAPVVLAETKPEPPAPPLVEDPPAVEDESGGDQESDVVEQVQNDPPETFGPPPPITETGGSDYAL